MASVSPPHSPPEPPPSSQHAPYQQLADADHCFLPSQASPTLPNRARSGSRTYFEAQADERQLARQRTRSRERAAAEDALEGRTSSDRGGAYEHAGDGMSMNELRAEMETLLSLRRRSMSQPVAVDPDLPATAPPTSSPPIKRPNLTLAIPSLTEGPGGGPVSPTAPSPAETGTLVRRRSSVGVRLPSEHPLPLPPPVPSPPLHLQHSPYSSASPEFAAPLSSACSSQNMFWLPASLHPELAPAEFKAFIREQTRPEALARRTSLSAGQASGSSNVAPSRMSRRASLLRGEYKPRANDGVGDEVVPPVPEISEGMLQLKRTASDGAARGQRRSRNTLSFEELTIKDLQRLEELAAKAEAEGTTAGEEEEGERLGRVLRRSLSLNPHRVAAAVAAAGASFGATLPSTVEEEASPSQALELNDDETPIIVPPPGQIVRRNARTRIRKGSIGGDGYSGGSRFGSARRARSSTGDMSIDTGESEPRSAEGPPASSEGEGEGPSPPSSDQQHIEVDVLPPSEPAPLLPTKGEQAPVPQVMVDRPGLEAEPAPVIPPAFEYLVASPVETMMPVAPPVVAPSPPPQHAISPASAEYDWSTHHLPAKPQPAPAPPPAEPQYTVHPQHLPRQPFGDVPPPQVVPVPQPRKEVQPAPLTTPVAAPPRAESPKPSGKEKKSGWARLGLGRDDEGKKRRSKGKERAEEGSAASAASSAEKERESSGGGSSGFLGGLFGRKRVEHEPAPPRAPSPPPQPRIPPPPPTASGVLLPNGRYANFYRLPIHVERAVYRLSHIKLANPRRPLYEQVLISNLMFWYLGLIQKPVAPPPAAPPVPIPGLPSPPASSSSPSSNAPIFPSPPPASPQKESHKRMGLSKPSRAAAGSRPAAETPMRTVSYEKQNQQLVEEQQQHQHKRYGQDRGTQHAYGPAASAGAPPRNVFMPSLSSPGAIEGGPTRSPERTSAPAAMYAASAGAGRTTPDDDDDRPLGMAQARTNPVQQQQQQQQQQRESFPPNRPAQPPPQPHPAQPAARPGFEVTSRRVSGGGGSGGGGADPSRLGSAEEGAKHERRASAVSFDAGEIYDAYAPSSPGGLASSRDPPAVPAPVPAPAPPRMERPPGAVLGAVAPRGSSLRALSR